MKYDRAALMKIEDSYAPDTRFFLQYLERYDLEMSIESLRSYLIFLRDQGKAAATIRKRLNGARNRIRLVFAQSEEGRDAIALFEFEREIKAIKVDRVSTHEVPDDKILSREDVRALLEADGVTERVKHMIRFLAWTGLRVSELLHIRIADCTRHSDHYSIRVRRGKGKKERIILLPLALVDEIRAHFASRVYLFETRSATQYNRREISDSIREAGRAVLGKKISAHTMRHFFATNSIKLGRPIDAVSRYLGHASTSITLDMYSHNRLSLSDIDPFAETGQPGDSATTGESV